MCHSTNKINNQDNLQPTSVSSCRPSRPRAVSRVLTIGRGPGGGRITFSIPLRLMTYVLVTGTFHSDCACAGARSLPHAWCRRNQASARAMSAFYSPDINRVVLLSFVLLWSWSNKTRKLGKHRMAMSAQTRKVKSIRRGD